MNCREETKRKRWNYLTTKCSVHITKFKSNITTSYYSYPFRDKFQFESMVARNNSLPWKWTRIKWLNGEDSPSKGYCISKEAYPKYQFSRNLREQCWKQEITKKKIPSTSMPLGTKGTEPVAMIISLAVTSLSEKPTLPYFTLWGPWNNYGVQRLKPSACRSRLKLE